MEAYDAVLALAPNYPDAICVFRPCCLVTRGVFRSYLELFRHFRPYVVNIVDVFSVEQAMGACDAVLAREPTQPFRDKSVQGEGLEMIPGNPGLK